MGKARTISAWQLDNVMSHKEVYLESQKNTKNSRRWTPVISQTRSWNLSVRGTQTGLCSEVTLKDDSGSYAVLAEQGSSVSQITAAIAMGVIARLIVQEKKPTQHQLAQVRLEDAPKLLKIPKSECPDEWLRLPRHEWPQSWSHIE